MAGATFSRIKNWNIEILTNSDLNTEIDNILNNLNPLGMDDYSANITQMRKTTDAGEGGSESLATSIAGEIERLRFEILQLKGGTTQYWYSAAPSSISDLRQLIGTGESSSTRISSGQSTGRSSQLNALTPGGTSPSLKISGSVTPFIYYIDDVQYIINDDLTVVSSLVTAPSTGNTATLDDTNLAAGPETRLQGEYGTVLNVTSMGANMQSPTNKLRGFKVVSGGVTEYFTGHVVSNTQIKYATRGGYFNSSGNAIPKVTLNNGDTITLMNLTWLFLTTAKTFLITQNEPVYAATAPSSPANGDFWYDMTNKKWKRFDGTVYQDSSVILVGTCMQDGTNCVAARTAHRFTSLSDLNTIDLEIMPGDATLIRTKTTGQQTSVFGVTQSYGTYRPQWSTTGIDTGYTIAANTPYYLYIKETGATVITPIPPTDRRGNLKGYYHPNEMWRYVGKCTTNGSSQFNKQTLVVMSRTKETKFFSNDFEDVGSLKMQLSASVAPGWSVAEGASISRFFYNELYLDGFAAMGNATGTANNYVFNLPGTKGMFVRGFDNATGNDPDAASRTASATGGATGNAIGTLQADAFQGHFHAIYGNTGQGANAGAADDIDNNTANLLSNVNVRQAVTDGTNGTPRLSSETRPKNLMVQYVIKVLS